MRGLINIHYYYIPINKVEGWDSNVLWIKITENHVKENYERNILPNPKQYYIKTIQIIILVLLVITIQYCDSSQIFRSDSIH
jgi:hypothetical protein